MSGVFLGGGMAGGSFGVSGSFGDEGCRIFIVAEG